MRARGDRPRSTPRRRRIAVPESRNLFIEVEQFKKENYPSRFFDFAVPFDRFEYAISIGSQRRITDGTKSFRRDESDGLPAKRAEDEKH